MEPPKDTKILESRTGIYWHDRVTKITYAIAKPDFTQTLEDGKANFQRILEVNDNQSCPLVVDIRDSNSIDKQCRDYYASDDYVRAYKACAILIGNEVSRIIGNFFMGFNKPKKTTKLFTDEAKAVEWLKTFN